MRNTVWLYWEGPQPDYIRLCCRTVSEHNDNVVLLDRASFDDLFVQDRDIDIDSLAINHKSDFIRAYLLKHYGGLYLDADCIVMKNLNDILKRAESCGFVGYREPGGYMSCNFMASREQGSVISTHYEKVCARIRSRQPLEWLDLASVPMNEAVDLCPEEVCLLPTEHVMPIPWNESSRFCSRGSEEEHEAHFNHEALCYMLSNNTIESRDETRILRYLPEADILNDSCLLSYLLRRSLGVSKRSLEASLTYLGGHENKTLFDEGAFDYLASRFQVQTMVDIGCGLPGMVYYALSRGLRAVGVDGDPRVANDFPVVLLHDYTRGPLYVGEFDLGWSVEFVEHVDEDYIPNFMVTFLCCRHVFITAAVPGQPGYHHVNCQNQDYWTSRFEAAGFTLDREATQGVRNHSTMLSRFTEQTGLVFDRNSH